MFQENGDRAVTLFCVSLGCSVSHNFLTQSYVSQEWKDQYIHGYVTLVGAWSGGARTLEVLLHGLTPLFPVDWMESLYWILPRAESWDTKTIVSTPSYSYTTRDYEKLFSDANQPDSFTKLKQALSAIENPEKSYIAPNVPTYCIYVVSAEQDTPVGLKYSKDFDATSNVFEMDHEVIRGPGDGVVPELDSEVCLKWRIEMDQHFESLVCGGSHTTIGDSDKLYALIDRVVTGPRPANKNHGLSLSNSLDSLAKVLSRKDIIKDEVVPKKEETKEKILEKELKEFITKILMETE